MARRSRIITARLGLLLLIISLPICLMSFSAQRDVILLRRQEIAARQQEAVDLEEVLSEAQRKLEFAQTDEFIIRIARSKLLLAMNDQEMLFINRNASTYANEAQEADVYPNEDMNQEVDPNADLF